MVAARCQCNRSAGPCSQHQRRCRCSAGPACLHIHAHEHDAVPSAVVPHLRSLSKDVLRQKLAAVQGARSRFFFRSRLTEPPNAVNTITEGICRRHK